jgi:hypothetical protein
MKQTKITVSGNGCLETIRKNNMERQAPKITINKFWEELIRPLLYISPLFEVLEPNLMSFFAPTSRAITSTRDGRKYQMQQWYPKSLCNNVIQGYFCDNVLKDVTDRLGLAHKVFFVSVKA